MRGFVRPLCGALCECGREGARVLTSQQSPWCSTARGVQKPLAPWLDDPGRHKAAQAFSRGKPCAGLVRSGPFARGVLCGPCADFLGWDFLKCNIVYFIITNTNININTNTNTNTAAATASRFTDFVIDGAEQITSVFPGSSRKLLEAQLVSANGWPILALWLLLCFLLRMGAGCCCCSTVVVRKNTIA